MEVRTQRYKAIPYGRHAVLLIAIVVLMIQYIQPAAISQSHKSDPAPGKPAGFVKKDPIDRAIATICDGRRIDSQASMPIDQMAFRGFVPLSDQAVELGRLRAERLLPVAKRLVPFALRNIALKSGVPLDLGPIVRRTRPVHVIRVEIGERDNAAWRLSDPEAIIFGTTYLTGLRSDEAMVQVLAHELTHAVDGGDQSLEPLFSRVAMQLSRSASSAGYQAVVELTCELVGIEVVRDYISQTPKRGGAGHRLARAFQKDCVDRDIADEHHLSPRTTLRTLLDIEPSVSKTLNSGSIAKSAPKQKRRPRMRKSRSH